MQTSSVNMIKSWVRNENSIINSGKSTEPDLKFWARGNPGPRYLIAQAQLCYKDVITSNYNHCCNYQIMNKNLLKVTVYLKQKEDFKVFDVIFKTLVEDKNLPAIEAIVVPTRGPRPSSLFQIEAISLINENV